LAECAGTELPRPGDLFLQRVDARLGGREVLLGVGQLAVLHTAWVVVAKYQPA
jgi:hypothetical protein